MITKRSQQLQRERAKTSSKTHSDATTQKAAAGRDAISKNGKGKKKEKKSSKSAILIFNSLKMFNRIYFMPVGDKDRKSNKTLF